MNKLGTIPEAISSSSYGGELDYSDNGYYSESSGESDPREYKQSDDGDNSQSTLSGMLLEVICLDIDSFSYSDDPSILIHSSRASKSPLDVQLRKTVIIAELYVIYREKVKRVVKIVIRHKLIPIQVLVIM